MSGEAYELPETRMELREPALDPIEEGRGSLGGGANSDDNIFVHIATEVSISSTFYKQPFHTKLFFSTFGLVILCQKNIGAKAACKMLVKLITGWSRLRADWSRRRRQEQRQLIDNNKQVIKTIAIK
jgi:hypothetical protein